MRKKKKKCPVCGEKLQPMYGKLMCPSCGYSINPDNTYSSTSANTSYGNTYGNPSAGTYDASGNPSANSYGNTYNNQTGNTYNNSQNNTGQTQSMFNYNDDHMSSNTSSGRGTRGMQPISNKAMKSILISAGVLIFWGALVFYFLGLFEEDYKTDYTYENINFPTYSFSQGNNSISGSSGSNSSSDKATFSYPQSELYLDLIEDIFDKNYVKITEDEINSIVSLRINTSDEEIKCGLSDGNMYSYHFFDASYSTDDLNCFKGLQYIDVDTKLEASDIDCLTNLKGVFSENTIKDFSNIIPNPNNIVSLGSYEDFFVKNLDGISSFKNLEQLYIKSSYLSDISDLKKLTGLKYLCLDDASKITDFTPVTYLTSLEVFDVTSSKIKNLSFLDNLNGIKEFSLRESKITDISALEKYKSTLTKLCLYENYDVADYSVIGEFTNLTELSICGDSNAVMPNLSKNTKLASLMLERAYDLSILSTVNNLSELYLTRCSLLDLPDLSHLTGLYYVRIDDSSSLITNLTPFTKLPALECFDISNTKVFGNVEEIFDIPTLYELYMDNCKVCIDFSKIQGNNNLEVLSMNNITVMEYELNQYGSVDTSNGKKADINDGLNTAMQKFPQLMELYVAGDGITSLDFVAELPWLWKIDVSDNYISSLAPLKSLTELSVVWCKDNTITDGYDLGENVYVIYE